MSDKKINPLYQHIPMQPNEVMMKNPLIQYMASHPNWTISNDKKVPLNAHNLLTYNTTTYANFHQKPYPAVTLHELNKEPKLQYTNRTYWFQAQKNRIMMIDVEPEASNDILKAAYHFPSHYTEISKSGGIHLVLQIPEELITTENSYLLTTTVIKDDNTQTEYLFNNHCGTFTKKIVIDKAPADFKHNIEHKQALAALLKHIVTIDKDRKEIREKTKQLRIEYEKQNIHTNLVDKLLKTRIIQLRIEKEYERQIEDYNNDLSRYEFAVALSCVGTVIYAIDKLQSIQNGNTKDNNTFHEFNQKDIIYTGYSMLEQIVEPRKKHDEHRNGLPFLLYRAKQAYEHIIASKS